MKFLFCCEYYAPSRGGVQEVMQQIAERLVKIGHEVTVATTALVNRDFAVLNGVKIEGFKVSGNYVNGMQGELGRYRQYVRSFKGEAILIKAAEQWTFDALWNDFDSILIRKVFIPCGFLSFYNPAYEEYFLELPSVLKKMDKLIFYSSSYRDINFVREHGIEHYSILSNGASEEEFSVKKDPMFRSRYSISPQDNLILLVGSLTGGKGHLELAKSFELMQTKGNSTLILNGNNPYNNGTIKTDENIIESLVGSSIKFKKGSNRKIWAHYLKNKKKIFNFLFKNIRYPARICKKVKETTVHLRSHVSTPYQQIQEVITRTHHEQPNKRILLIDLPRPELVQAYLAADLFVLSSYGEYSPLVLFEAAAAATPFISSPVGNAEEIISWLGGGWLCKSSSDQMGFQHVDISALSQQIGDLLSNRENLEIIGKKIQSEWQRQFTWGRIVKAYEAELKGD